jgi:hypothetical protein
MNVRNWVGRRVAADRHHDGARRLKAAEIIGVAGGAGSP